MQSFQEVIKAFGVADLAADLNVAANTVKQWHTRDKIPDEHWLAVAEAAKRRGIRGVTPSTLAALSAAKKAA